MKRLADQSQGQQEGYIHLQALDTKNIIFTHHVLKRMAERAITTGCVVEVLRQGRMKRPAEPNLKTGSLECRLDRHVDGQAIGVVVVVDDDNPHLIVITAMN